MTLQCLERIVNLHCRWSKANPHTYHAKATRVKFAIRDNTFVPDAEWLIEHDENTTRCPDCSLSSFKQPECTRAKLCMIYWINDTCQIRVEDLSFNNLFTITDATSSTVTALPYLRLTNQHKWPKSHWSTHSYSATQSTRTVKKALWYVSIPVTQRTKSCYLS